MKLRTISGVFSILAFTSILMLAWLITLDLVDLNWKTMFGLLLFVIVGLKGLGDYKETPSIAKDIHPVIHDTSKNPDKK
jgi:hypothetical protein